MYHLNASSRCPSMALLAAVVASGCSGPTSMMGTVEDRAGMEASAETLARNGSGAPGEPPPGSTPSESPASAPPTSPESVALVARALDLEYLALSSYTRVIEQLGPVGPFPNIVLAEEQHVASLAALLSKRDLPVPPDPYTPDTAGVPDLESLGEACAFALVEEQQILDLYESLLLESLPQDLAKVFANLRDATGVHHIPAFERCAAR
jgi:hypothetical protein